MVAAAAAAAGDGRPPWCEPEDLLASLYGFTHLNCSSLQDQRSVQDFCSLLARFVKGLRVRSGRRAVGGRMGGACK